MSGGCVTELTPEHDEDAAALDECLQELQDTVERNRLEVRRIFPAALIWLEQGFNVVPHDHDDKHPSVNWKELQRNRVTEKDLREWFWKFANGVGFITGAISGVIVIDTDGPEGEAVLDEFQALNGPFPETLTIRSGSRRGLHRYFKHPGYPVKTKSNTEIKIDIKGDGGFAVLPFCLQRCTRAAGVTKRSSMRSPPRCRKACLNLSRRR
jgi:hypothetical protein